MTFVCLITFLFQATIAQTHIHIPGSSDSGVLFQSVPAGVANHGRAPDQTPQDDLSKCPFCQVVAAVGSAIGPSSFYFIHAAADGIVVALRELPLPDRTAPAHAWHSRGPPRH